MAFGFVVPVLGGGFLSGLWLAFIGWFLNGAAIASYRQVVLQSILRDVPVTRLMRRGLPPAILPSEPLSKLVDTHLLGSDATVFPVGAEGGIETVVSADAVLRVPRDLWATTPVSAVATRISDFPSIPASIDAFEAWTRLTRSRAQELIVLDDDRLVGLLRREDIMRWLELHPSEPGRKERAMQAPVTT
jgi:hypothetical protein